MQLTIRFSTMASSMRSLVYCLLICTVLCQESNICSGPLDLLDAACSRTVTVPTGVDVIYRQDCVDIPCTGCSKQQCGETCVSVPCTGCSKQQCGETCVSATVPCTGCSKQNCGETCFFGACTNNCCTWPCDQEACTNNCCEWDCGQNECTNNCCEWDCGQNECIDVPDTLVLTTSEMNVCGVLETFLSGIDVSQTLATVEVLCSCIIEALEYIEENVLGTEESYTQTTFESLLVAGRLVDCFGESTASTDKEMVLATIEDAEGDEIFAPEIGLVQYTALSGAVVSCYLGGQCQDIWLVFEEIFTETISEVGPALLSTFRDHYVEQIFRPVRDLNGMFNTLSESVTQHVESIVQCGVDEVQNTINEAIFVFKEKVSLVQKAIDDVITVADAIEEVVDGIGDILDSFDKSLLQQLIDAISQGMKPSLLEAVEFLSTDEHLTTIQSHGSDVYEFFQGVETHLDELLESIEVLRAEVLDVGPFEECVSGNTLDLMEELSSTSDSFLEKILSFLDAGSLGFRVETGIGSYSSWIDAKIDNFPCSRLTSQEFSSDICPFCTPIVADVPEVYPCSWAQQIPLPKEHTPFIRIIWDNPVGGGSTTTGGPMVGPPPSWAPLTDSSPTYESPVYSPAYAPIPKT